MEHLSPTPEWLTVSEAAERLGVKRETIYAYISRGRLTSRPSDDGRGSMLDPLDVDRLRGLSVRKGPAARHRGRVASAITRVQDGEIHYRGRDALTLSRTATFEQAAELLWGIELDSATDWQAAPSVTRLYRRLAPALPDGALPLERLRFIAALIATTEPPIGRGSSRSALAGRAARLLAAMVAALPEQSKLNDEARDLSPSYGFASLLWSRLCSRKPSTIELGTLNAALILLADHDLAASTHAVRIAARADVDLTGVVRLGLDIGSGPVKGGASLAVEAFLDDLDSPHGVEAALRKRHRQGEPVPGFGHVVHPSGDPRARELLRLLTKWPRSSNRSAIIDEILQRQSQKGLPPPNAGLALAALAYMGGMIPGAGEAIFVVARCVGWISHAMEEYELGPSLEREHSVYIGPKW